MIKSNNGKAIVYGIVFLFLFTSFIPVNESLSLMKNTSYPSLSSTIIQQNNIEDQRERSSPYGIVPSKTTSDTSKSPGKTPIPHRILDMNKQQMIRDHIAYAYNAYDPSGEHPMGWVSFYLNNPDAIDLIAPGIEAPSGADFLNETIMYFVSSGGGLYRLDTQTGQTTFIGSTIPLLGLTYDSLSGNWYASDADYLYSIDIYTAETSLIGPFNIDTSMIDIACDRLGNLYGYDVLWTGDSTLFSIDISYGTATPIGSMGYGFVYLQGMAYDRDNEVLYIAGYFNDGSPSGLLTCDVTTGQCTLIGSFEGGMELCGFAIPWSDYQFDHDISIESIITPSSGYAAYVAPLVKVKNTGTVTETNVPVNLQISKEQLLGSIEDFEENNASYIHFATLTDNWQYGIPTSGPGAAHSGLNLWATILGGNYPNNMWTGLKTPPFVVPAGMMFTFWHWYQFETGWDGGNVKISTDGGSTYSLITPIGGYPGTLSSNPYMTGQPGYTGPGGNSWHEETFNLSLYESMEVIILWEAASDVSNTYAGWYIDDVGFSAVSYDTEYNQTLIIPTIAPQQIINISYPTWTPIDLGLIENIDYNYRAKATNLYVDENNENDYQVKLFTLLYGYYHDVAVSEIVSPISGSPVTQTPIVQITNPGQNLESINVSMTIGKALYTTLLEDDFSDGVPPTGWGTNYPNNWYSSDTHYAGGETPEAVFSWTPSSVDEHYLWTYPIDTTGFTTLSLLFKEYVNDYNSDYTLKIVTSTNGGQTWDDAYIRAGGPYGPTTTQITLDTEKGVGSSSLQIAWGMSGDSYNINYWYIDDVWLGIIDSTLEYNETVSDEILPGETREVSFPDWTPADLPLAMMVDYIIQASVFSNSADENPVDNEKAKIITLSFEHDVGVIEIIEPSGPSSRVIFWDNYGDDGTGTGLSSQLDVEYPFNSQCADDFQFNVAVEISQVHWWGQFYNGDTYPNPVEFNIIFYEDAGGAPSGAGMDDPTSTALAVYNFPAVTGISYGPNKYEYDVSFEPGFVANADVKYWVAIQAVFPFLYGVQWGWSTNGANPDQLSSPVQGFPLLGTPYWTTTTYGDHAFQLCGNIGEIEPWPPGTYPVEGFIKNLGLSYTESNIPVNTKITYLSYEELLIYNETIVVPGPLAPDATTVAIFPDVTLSDDGQYVLEMQTMLPNDDHPSNNKKTLNFEIKTNPPPFTWAELTGVLGQNDWYISDVTVYLFAEDYKWPTGVNYTMMKIDNGEWFEYTGPIIVSSDGAHTVSFYSVDYQDNVEEIRSVSFKIDQNVPTVGLSVERNGMHQWRIITVTSDQTSGIHLIQCYVDSLLYGEVFDTETYEWSWTGKGNHTVMVIAYDNAGNSASNTVTFSLSVNDFLQQQFQLFPFLSKIIQTILSYFSKALQTH